MTDNVQMLTIAWAYGISSCIRFPPSTLGHGMMTSFTLPVVRKYLADYRVIKQRINDITLMQVTNNDNPVLNNPYEEPKYYYDTVRGNLDYNKVLKGRRPYMGNIDITPSTRMEGDFFISLF